MGVLTEIPAMVQIKAARAFIEIAERLDLDIPQDVQETADWPMEKAWDYEPPRHPITPETTG